MRSLRLPVAFTLALAVCLVLPACAAPAPQEEEATTLTTDDERTVYAIGLVMAQNLGQFTLSEAEMELMIQGLRDGITGNDPLVDLNEIGPKIQGFAQARAQAAAAKEETESAAYVEEQAAMDGAVKTDSGIVYTVMTEGDGASPAASDTVKVHYHGTLRDGTVFDSSVARGQPAQFALNGVIPCWTEAVQRMKVGGKHRIVCPANLAYGPGGRPGIPGGAALTFEVELLEIVAPPAGG